MFAHNSCQLFADYMLDRKASDSGRFGTSTLTVLLCIVLMVMLACVAHMQVFVTVSHAKDLDSADPKVLFEDNFDDGLKPDWKRFGPFSEPAVEGGKLVMSAKLQGALVGNSNTAWTDYVVEVDVAVEGYVPTGGSSFYMSPQIVFRTSTPENGWGNFYLVAFWDKRVHLYKRTGETVEFTNMAAEFPKGVELGAKPIRVRIEVKGNTIGVSVNGQECINYTDIRAPLTFGGAGIQSWQMPIGSKWVFDNFIIYQY